MKIEVENYKGGFCFLIWRGCTIVDSGYGFDTPTRAAESAAKALADMREAKRITRRARFPWLFHTGNSVATKDKT